MITVPIHITADQVSRRLDEFVDLYRAVYAEPPYEETNDDAVAFGIRLAAEAGRPGFALVAAEDDSGLIGFSHGFTFAADQWWSAAASVPIEVRGHPKFAIMELIVRNDRRKQGYASALMRCLLDDRPEPFATLCTNPAALARSIYKAWGWRQVGSTPTRPTFPAMDVLLLSL